MFANIDRDGDVDLFKSPVTRLHEDDGGCYIGTNDVVISNHVKHGLSEFDYAGGHCGVPIDVVQSEVYGLPVPATAELVLEGEMYPGEQKTEGPFGEFTGYYAGEVEPVEDIDIIRNMWSTPLHPMIPHGAKTYTNSRAIIDACRPF